MRPVFDSSHSMIFDADDTRFSSKTGVTEPGRIVFDGAPPGIALFGGYLDLDRGRYRAIVWLDPAVARAGHVLIEVCNELGQNVVASAEFDAGRLSAVAPFIDLPFTLSAAIKSLEVRVHAQTPLTCAIARVELISLDLPRRPEPVLQAQQHRAPLNILYYSCHEVLEYDELRMLTQQGHRVFSLGAYCNPGASPRLRKPLPGFYHQGDFERFTAEGLSPEFVDQFDVAIVMHQPEKVPSLVSAYPGLAIVYRSIGQSNLATEAVLAPYADKISIVRYSERERDIEGFLPASAVIYFGKYQADYGGLWAGGNRVLTFHNNYAKREVYNCPNLNFYQGMAREWPCDLYGMGNDDLQGARGEADPAEQLALYKRAAAYLYVYTVPPSYTLSFIEAMASGVPIIVPSADFIVGNVAASTLEMTGFSGDRYEIPDLLDNDDRLIYSSTGEAHAKVRALLENQALGLEVSGRLRAKFAAKFDAVMIGAQWTDFLHQVVDKAAATRSRAC